MRPRLLLFTSLALVACRTAGDGSDEATLPQAEDPGGPSEWEYTPDGDEPEATFDAAAVELAVDEALTGMLTVGAAPVLDAYTMLMEQADSDCPSWYENEGNVFWYSRCTTDAGTFYDGYGFVFVYEDAEVFGEGQGHWDLTQVSGAATIRDADGHTFHLGGAAYDGVAVNQWGGTSWATTVLGGFQWDAPDAAGTWLGDDVSPGLQMYAIDIPPEAGAGFDGRFIQAVGTVGGVGTETTGAQVELIQMSTQLGFPCDIEPYGTVSVRDADGTWWDVTFDVVIEDDDYALAGECDGCGAVTLHGEYVGDACVDTSFLLDWTEQPW